MMWIKRLYILSWVASLAAWMAVLANYVMHYSFLGCDGRSGLSLVLCHLLSRSMDPVLMLAFLSLPILTIVLIARAIIIRGYLMLETLLAVVCWLLFFASAKYFPSS